MIPTGNTALISQCLAAFVLLACEGEGSSTLRPGGEVKGPVEEPADDGLPDASADGSGAGDALTPRGDNAPGSDDDDSPGAHPEVTSMSQGGTANGGSASGENPESGTGGTGMAGGTSDAEGSTGATGGASLLGGAPNAGAPSGGTGAGGESTSGTGTGGTGDTSATTNERPCDLYESAGTPCVGAYSPIRTLSSNYDGPLYQVRSGSSVTNRGRDGELHDIGATEDGFADVDAVDAVCSGTICTVSLIYDQSGRGNHLPLSRQPSTNTVPPDFYETVIHRDDGLDELVVGGHRVYSLYMEPAGGYSLSERGDGVPFAGEAQGVYLLADGTHSSPACCWTFGNVTTDLERGFASNALLFGTAYWGHGEGAGPWFMLHNGSGVFAGGTNSGDPGWGAIADDPVMNPDNPSMAVPLALGFLKTDQDSWQLRMANAQTADDITTAYAGGLPVEIDNEGAITLGAHAVIGNVATGTFLEGAIVAGFPADDTDLEVLQNIQAAAYGAD